jgi:hypothetical protein
LAVGVYVSEQEAWSVVRGTLERVHNPPPLKVPELAGEAVKLTVPVGLDLVPEPVSVTVAVQVVAWLKTTEDGLQDTPVVVVRTALKVTVRAGPEPVTVKPHGLVVPAQPVKLVLALHPANVEPLLGVADNVPVALLLERVMFGEHVLVTV